MRLQYWFNCYKCKRHLAGPHFVLQVMALLDFFGKTYAPPSICCTFLQMTKKGCTLTEERLTMRMRWCYTMDKELFGVQVMAMRDTLYRVSATLLRREADREDAISEAIAKALVKLPGLRKPEAFQSWMIRILINECYNILRRHKREIAVERVPDVYFAPEDSRELYQAFQTLEEKYRLPIMLHYVEGYSVEEIARMLRRPEGTVKSQLMRGRMKLRVMLDEEVSA